MMVFKNEIRSHLHLEDVTAYIRKSGWIKQDHPNANLLVFTGPQKDDSGNEIKLVLPNGNDFSDSEKKISTAVHLLSELEKLSIAEIIQKIKNRGVDILRQRIFNNTRLSNLPLELAPSIIQRLRDLVYHAACSEEDPQPYFDKGRKIGKVYTQKCRFGHTFHGSFGLSIEMPIPPNSTPSFPNEAEAVPLERRIMERIIRGLQISANAVHEGNVDIITNGFDKGFNANLCEVMTQLTESLEEFNIEYSMLWSSEFSVEQDIRAFSNITIEPSVYRPFFESAAKSLRAARESIETEIFGKITHLQALSIDDNEEDGLKTDARQIVIYWEMENGRKTNIRVSLNPEDYRSACDAHKDSKAVSIKGKPEKHGKFWILTSPSGFKIQETIR